jgi:hypothetical protein
MVMVGSQKMAWEFWGEGESTQGLREKKRDWVLDLLLEKVEKRARVAVLQTSTLEGFFKQTLILVTEQSDKNFQPYNHSLFVVTL